MPPLTREEQLEVMSLQYCRKTSDKNAPFSGTTSYDIPAGTGGRRQNSKARRFVTGHCGILFLDEMPEFSANVLEVLRQPLEEKKVQIARTQGIYRYPADFMLVCGESLSLRIFSLP